MAVRGVELLDELGEEVLVLERLVGQGQRRAVSLALGGGGVVAVGGGGVGVAVAITATGLLVVELAAQAVEVEAAQGIRAEAGGLEQRVGGHVGRLLQQVRDAAKDGRGDAVGVQALEQQQGLEAGVGGAGGHRPGGARAMGRARNGSQRGGRGVYERRAGIACGGRDGRGRGDGDGDGADTANCRGVAALPRPRPSWLPRAPANRARRRRRESTRARGGHGRLCRARRRLQHQVLRDAGPCLQRHMLLVVAAGLPVVAVTALGRRPSQAPLTISARTSHGAMAISFPLILRPSQDLYPPRPHPAPPPARLGFAI